jgi:hypothetical protein
MAEEPKVKKEYTAEEFVKAFTKLCQEYGFDVRPELGWKQQIDGTFTIAVQLRIIPIQKQ